MLDFLSFSYSSHDFVEESQDNTRHCECACNEKRIVKKVSITVKQTSRDVLDNFFVRQPWTLQYWKGNIIQRNIDYLSKTNPDYLLHVRYTVVSL